jgi:hypothetical protein
MPARIANFAIERSLAAGKPMPELQLPLRREIQGESAAGLLVGSLPLCVRSDHKRNDRIARNFLDAKGLKPPKDFPHRSKSTVPRKGISMTNWAKVMSAGFVKSNVASNVPARSVGNPKVKGPGREGRPRNFGAAPPVSRPSRLRSRDADGFCGGE